MNPFRAPRVALLGVVLALTTAACVPPPKACTEIGATNGVRVTVVGLPGALDAQAGLDGVSVRACVGAVCGTGAFGLGQDDSTWVDLSAVDSTDPVDVVVTVSYSSGAVIVPATTVRVIPRKVQPNGAGCEPTAFQAQVTVASPSRAVP